MQLPIKVVHIFIIHIANGSVIREIKQIRTQISWWSKHNFFSSFSMLKALIGSIDWQKKMKINWLMELRIMFLLYPPLYLFRIYLLIDDCVISFFLFHVFLSLFFLITWIKNFPLKIKTNLSQYFKWKTKILKII